MNKQDIIQFFDRLAPSWDQSLVHNDHIINTILDNAEVTSGKQVLDVACGTGVLFGDYFSRQVGGLTAADISPEMVKIAREKFPQANVLCGDVESLRFDRKFDCIVVYNAFTHFPDTAHMIEVLSGHLNPGGTLTVAHGMSRHALDHHHSGSASKVSMGLMHEDALAELFGKFLDVTVKISDDTMYQITGKKA